MIDSDDQLKPPTTPSGGGFGRRLSFGAQAYREVNKSSAPGVASGGTRPPSHFLSVLSEKNENGAPSSAGGTGTAAAAGKGRGVSSASVLFLPPAAYSAFFKKHCPELVLNLRDRG